MAEKNAGTLKAGYRAILFGCVMVALGGCSSWKIMEEPPGAEEPMRLRLTLEDGSVVEVRDAFANRGVVAGVGRRFVEKGWRESDIVWDVAFSAPVEEVHKIERKQADPVKTLVFLGSVAAAGYFAISALTN